MQKITESVKELIKPILDELNFYLVDLEFVKEGSQRYLHIFIENQTNNISVDECELASDKIGNLLDKLDIIPYSYVLDISSPGLERELKNENDYINSINKYINVSLYVPVNGLKMYEGFLLEVNSNQIKIKIKNDKVIILDRKKVSKARLAIQF